MSRYRGNMLLIELVFTLLFFSLSMMIILQVFASAQQKSADSEMLHEALTMARDVAEQLSVEDDPDALLISLGFTGGDGAYSYGGAEGYDISVAVRREERAAGTLTEATLTAQSAGRTLFELPAARYAPKEVAAP